MKTVKKYIDYYNQTGNFLPIGQKVFAKTIPNPDYHPIILKKRNYKQKRIIL